MVAAKEKTLSFNVDPIANRMDSQPSRQRAASTTPTAINRISSYDFRTRKFKKSPIGPKVKIRYIVSLEINQRPRKYVGENVPRLRRSHQAPCMSLYRGYFVPGGVDPEGSVRMLVSKEKTGKCGGFRHKIKWQPDENEKDGYIVQKVCVESWAEPCKKGDSINCKRPRNLPVAPNKRACGDGCYIEVWRVKNRFIGVSIGGARERTDTFAKWDCPKSYGNHTISGEAIFIPFARVNEFDIRKLVHRGPRGVQYAFGLYSACLGDPGVQAFWTRASNAFGSSSTRRFSGTSWNCCEKDPCYGYQSEFDNYPVAPGPQQ